MAQPGRPRKEPKHYEYVLIREDYQGKFIAEVNRMAREGWRAIAHSFSSATQLFVMMEREIGQDADGAGSQ